MITAAKPGECFGGSVTYLRSDRDWLYPRLLHEVIQQSSDLANCGIADAQQG